ncbi:MAG: hypothetical protein IKC46_03900 [Lachnospiraceae bacterium]|nr:hypothetical protein [Lachnospiraceae bacterium]
MIRDYLKKVGWRRILVMTLGNVFLGMGVAIFKMSGMGTDPFSAMVMSLSETVGIPYAIFIVLFNLIIFGVEIAFGRQLIGIGTIVNACLLGAFTTFFYELFTIPFGVPQNLPMRFVLVFAGVLAVSFGVSMYQTPDVGVAPWDSLSLIMVKRWPKIPYFWHRIFGDSLAVVIAVVLGGVVGLGTALCAFCLGPFIQFFSERYVKKMLGWK